MSFTGFSGKVRIVVIGHKLTWEEAFDYCLANHSGLLRIEDEKDQEDVVEIFKTFNVPGPFLDRPEAESCLRVLDVERQGGDLQQQGGDLQQQGGDLQQLGERPNAGDALVWKLRRHQQGELQVAGWKLFSLAPISVWGDLLR